MPAFTGLRYLPYGYAIPSIISYVCMVALALLLRHYSVARYPYVPQRYLILVVVTDIVGALSGSVFIGLLDRYEFLNVTPSSGSFLVQFSASVSIVDLVVCISLLTLVLIAYVMFSMLAEERANHIELLMMRRNTVENMSTANSVMAAYQSVREVRHEIKNHDAYMLSLVEKGEYEKLKKFVSRYAHSHEVVTGFVSSGNQVVDAVVNAKESIARSRGLVMRAILAVPPDLPYDEDDVFCLLANMIDNAIEGASRAQNGKQINVSIIPERGYYFVTVTNPCDPGSIRCDADGNFLTSKADHEVHGYGTRVIRRIAEQYGGSARFSVSDQTFTAVAMLKRSQRDREAGTAGMRGAEH